MASKQPRQPSKAPVSNASEAKHDTAVVSCPVCFEEFDARRRIPKNLACGHTFCEGCLHTLSVFPGECGGILSYKCPTCRMITTKTHTMQQLVTNFALLSVVDTIRNTTCTRSSRQRQPAKDGLPVCDEHGERLVLFCRSDQTLICILCRDYGSHRNHDCQLASVEVNNVKDAMNSQLACVRDDVTRLEHDQEEIADRLSIASEQQKIMEDMLKMDDYHILKNAHCVLSANGSRDPASYTEGYAHRELMARFKDQYERRKARAARECRMCHDPRCRTPNDCLRSRDRDYSRSRRRRTRRWSADESDCQSEDSSCYYWGQGGQDDDDGDDDHDSLRRARR